MIQKLIHHNRYQTAWLLFGLSCICVALGLFRMGYSETRHFFFLNWNLFLAFVPWVLTTLLIVNSKLQERKLLVFAILGIWLLFFPNAPYILTDLFHLSHHSSMPIWFDLVLILAYAWTGLLYGFLSLWDLEEILGQYIEKRWIPIISVSFMFLGSFGIYLGRFLRWNSWDLMQRPGQLLEDVGDRFVNPADHPTTWGVTIFMGVLLSMIYFTLRYLRKANPVLNHQ